MRDYVRPQGGSDMQRLNPFLDTMAKLNLRATVPPMITVRNDIPMWLGSSDGCFSIASAHLAVSPVAETDWDSLWGLVWHWKGPERLWMLLWKVAQGVLLTNNMRVQRAMTTSDSCPVCGEHVETILHAVRDCTKARAVWLLAWGGPITFLE